MRPAAGAIPPLLATLAILASPAPWTAHAEPPRTAAEKSDYQATSRHADVLDFCRRLAKESPLVRMAELGTSQEGRTLPLLILADPPVSSPAEAARGNRLVVFAMGNIHAGEVDGKEALLMLARDLANAKDRPLLKDLVLVFAPLFNADGNEKISKTNRPRQNGPPEGVGTRANAGGLDLNRDFVKLESPEVRALARFLNQWDPAVVIDCHTTNGSYHRYTMTYEGGRCPAGEARLIAHVRDRMLPDVGRRLEKQTGYRSYFYGNFAAGHSRWETVLPTPRFGTHYVGLRNRIAILSESYTHAPFKDRVLASRGFVQAIFEYTAENKEAVRKLLAEARAATARPGRDPKAGDTIPLRYQAAPVGRPHALLGFVEESQGGRAISTGRPREYEVQYMGGTEATLSVPRPYAYLFPATLARVVENLKRHGIVVEELREDVELDLEVYRVNKITRAPAFQKHRPVSLDVTPRKEGRRVLAGTVLVRTAQPLGPLAAFLLEPQSLDGLVTWNFFDDVLKEGADFPVLRLRAAVPLTSGHARPLPEDRPRDRPITFESLYGSGPPLNFNGAPVSGLTWFDDGEHFVQRKEGRAYKVHALSGRCEPLYDPDKLTRSLGALPGLGRRAARSLARSPALNLNPQRTAALFADEDDLYYCPLDGGPAVRLTKTPGTKELATFSPDGRLVAFVRDNNLFAVDVATQTERALTTDGSAQVANGKADWVYFEEVFNRDRRAFWWSPDSTRVVFLRFDDTPVPRFNVVDHLPAGQTFQATPYPKAGRPNPLVKVGVVSAAGGGPRWADLGNYSETASLIVRAGWLPDSRGVYFYVQDRAQTWLDFCTVARDGGAVTRLYRETTKAWVDDPGPPTFLGDGSFLLPSARTGWNHLYHFDPSGTLKGAVTRGDWEVTTGPFRSHPVERVDEKGGWVYFTARRDSPIATNLYRVKLDGTALERLTAEPGDHRVTFSPRGNFFIDSWSSHAAPTRVRLCRADGSPARTLDTNPVYACEEYRLGQYEPVRIKTSDGFVLEGSLLKPPDFDPKRRYPVWLMVYGGPHLPTVRDNWGPGRVRDEMLAQMGFLVFHCDPRSASGKGHRSAWTAYRRLGAQELMDLETAVRWLAGHPWVDGGRVGISGGSYGGFLTLYALTHSGLFAAGVATAPVTDWRNYDSIYTERYMNTPQENPEGYDAASVVRAAKGLRGKLLLVHGLLDDNVHVQNSVQLVEALQRAGKDFEVMFYPRARHGIRGRHYQRLVIEFMRRALRPGQ
jgi:dipeptidyl aminopeptidase/acylaminoacyl peptidase